MNFYPKVSFVVFAKNEEKNIELCLSSIFSQNYPLSKLEVIFVDDFSTDKTAVLAKKFPIKYFLRDSAGERDSNKLFGFKKTTGEFITYLDADIHLRGKDWLQKMMKPLRDSSIAASFTRYYSDQHSTKIEQYLNLDPLQRDAVYQFFSPSPESTIIKKEDGYFVCEYKLTQIPPQGVCLHRRKLVDSHFNKRRFLELDVLVDLVMRGFTKFAYVPEAGMFHHHAKSLWELIKKRMRNVSNVYLVENEKRIYRWFDIKSIKGIGAIAFWIVWVHLIVPLTVSGILKSLKFKTLVGLYEPVVGLLATDAIILSFILDARSLKLLQR